MTDRRPFYLSRKWTAYSLTLVVLVALQALRAPVEVLSQIAMACSIGLPVLLGGQAWIDARRPTPCPPTAPNLAPVRDPLPTGGPT